MGKIDWYRIVDAAWKIATGIGLIRLYTWAQKKVEHWKKNKEQWRLLSIDLNNTISGDLNAIKTQLSPNGGNSLYDMVYDLKFGQRSTWELMDVAVWESDKNGRITYVSQALCTMIGCNVDDMLGFSWINKVAADHRNKIFDSWKMSVENASEFNETYPYKKDDGMYQMVNAIAIHLKDNQGKVISSKGRFIKVDEPYKYINPNKN